MDCSITDWISALSSAVQAVAVLLGLWIAYLGLDQWKRQSVWTKNSELAEEVMLAANAFRDSIARVRSPIGYSGEGTSRTKDQNEIEEVEKHLNYKFIPFERLGKERAAFTRLFDADARCRVRFPKAGPCLDALRKAFIDVRSAAQVRMELAEQDPYDRTGGDADLARQLDRTVMSIGTKENPDELAERIDGAVADLAKTLKEYVKELP